MQRRWHKLLERQIKQSFGDVGSVPDEVRDFVVSVNRAYENFENDHDTLEHALELNSDELVRANNDMQAIFKALPDLFIRLDNNNRILSFKRGSSTYLEFICDSIVGQHIVDTPIDSPPGSLQKLIDECRDTNDTVSAELKPKINGQEKYLEVQVLPLIRRQLLLVIRDVTEQRQIEQVVALSEKQVRAQAQILVNLVTSQTIFQGNINTTLREIAIALAEGLDTDRVSIWLYNEDYSAIKCVELYERAKDQHSKGTILAAVDYPKYFSALEKDRVIAADDAHTDPRTSEFSESYLTPLGINSMLDSAIRVGGQAIGVVCNEHIGPARVWTLEEQSFAGSVTDFVANIFETDKRVAVQKALTQSEEKFRILAESADTAIFVFSEQFQYVNPAMEKITGYREHELLNMSFEEIVHDNYKEKIDATAITRMRYSSGTIRHEIKICAKNGQERWLYVSIGIMQFDGKSSCMASAFDITRRKYMEDQLRHQAFHDKLTGLPNRALFMDRLERALTRNRRKPTHSFAVLYLDLDRFKVLNDSLGHLVGDQLLVEIAKRLESVVRVQDTVARLGGDEFTVLLEDIDINYVLAVAKRINEKLVAPFMLDDEEIFTTISIGIAMCDKAYQRADHMLRDADIALYRAKAKGKNCYEIFDEVMRTRANNLMKLETDLRKAIDKQEFVLFYQPVYTLESGEIRGFEALIRWLHPERSIVPPIEFIPLAEETGLIVPLGEWILREACSQLQQWQQQFPERSIEMAVNISSKQFVSPNFVPLVDQAIRQYDIAEKQLKLEITESLLMDNSSSIVETFFRLKSLGVELYLDDFGTGYSSLSYLHRFPIDVLKIDRSFIGSINEYNNIEIIKSIISLSKNLLVKVVAEGIETQEQLKQVKGLDCDYAQGFYFAKPLPADEAEELLKDKTADRKVGNA